MESKKDIETYECLVNLRNILKEIKQISWDINQTEKTFNEKDIEEIGYDKFILMYLGYNDRLQEVAKDFESFIKNDKVVKRLKNKEE